MVTGKKKSKKPLSKSALLKAIGDAIAEGELTQRQIKLVVEAMIAVGHRELRKTGIFVLPGFAKFVVVKKPARPAREAVNPFTKEKQRFAAKTASKGVRVRPVKAVKDALTATSDGPPDSGPKNYAAIPGPPDSGSKG